MVVITIFHSSLHIVTFSDGPMVYIHDHEFMCFSMNFGRRTHCPSILIFTRQRYGYTSIQMTKHVQLLYAEHIGPKPTEDQLTPPTITIMMT